MTFSRIPAILLLVGLLVSGAVAEEKPNFIVINIDDLGYGDIAPFGSTNNKTPHLDRMAQEGRKLTSHYAAPVCSPSRSALLTGCYPKRVLPIPGVLFPGAAVGLNPEELTIAELLKDTGYVTTCIGKWHVGDQPPFLPTRQGFDTYFGLPYSNDMGPIEDGAKSSLGKPLPQRRNNPGSPNPPETGIVGNRQPPLPLLENEKVLRAVDATGQAELTTLYTERAVKFIQDHKDQPFFLYLPHSAVHFPHYPRQEFVGKSSQGLFGDWVEEVDWSVGQVLDAVRNAGISSKTLVFFTSDNGGPVNQGALNTPLRGAKGSTLEGGMRVPAIAWWPGQIPAGTETAEITTMMDLLPTFVSLAGGKLPANRKIDGVNIWPTLSGTSDGVAPRIAFHYFKGFKLEAVRSGPWKLHLAKSELYDLRDDLGEARNVARQHPETVKRLWEMAINMQHDLGMDQIGPGCRALGRVENPQPLIHLDGTIRDGFRPE